MALRGANEAPLAGRGIHKIGRSELELSLPDVGAREATRESWTRELPRADAR